MRIRYSESFPVDEGDTEAAWVLIRKIVEDRLADEIFRRLQEKRGDQIA